MKSLMRPILCFFAASVMAGSSGGPKVGDDPPLLSATSLLQAPSSATLDASALRGSVVVLEFWATWCGPCVAAIPHLNELADQFKDKPVRFIAITAEDEATIRPFLQKRPIHAWVALDTNRAMNNAFAVTGIPHTVVLDKMGKIAAITYPTSLTPEHLNDLLESKPISLSNGRGEEVPNQKPNDKPSIFEVSIKTTSGSSDGGIGWGNGSLKARGCTVWRTLPIAFDTTFSRIVTNAPLPDGLYDIIITEPRASADEVPALLQTALRISFGLTGKKEVRQIPVYLLRTVAATAPGRTVSPTEAKSLRTGDGEISGIGVSTQQLASALEGNLNQPVIDETELKEDYDIKLKWKGNEADPSTRDVLVAAVRGQLGLELVPATRPIEMVVIEQTNWQTGSSK